ncbi:hypothetical protein [Vallitalea guaymasensis]|uniref:hypothetical protein n=1 Tax=Vallitalea guaymasensis TaxID=1185412 RepID=UPI000DE3791A|nr:hypothetical protein [Vallitalea guaymasensis]
MFLKRYFKTFSILLCITLILAVTIIPTSAAGTGVPVKPSLSHNQWSGDIDGDYDLTWNIWYGNNGTSWKLFEKIGAGNYQEIHSGTLIDDTPNPQSETFQVRGRTIEGTYKYYIELTNSYGTTASDEISVVVGNATGNIIINGIDTQKVVYQFTQAQGMNDYALSFNGVANPVFTVITNNSSVVDCSIVNNNTLKINGKKAGRASIKLKESTTGEERYVGIRIKNADGSIPGMPNYLSIGSVSEDKQGDLDFWRDFHTDDKNKRMDIRYIYINGGPINGWRTWTNVDGGRAKNFIIESRKLGIIPFFVYYNIPDSGESYSLDLAHIQDSTYMDAYYKDLKFFLDICKEYAEDDTVGIVFEPDFLGYMMQQSGKQPNEITALVSAAYSSGVLTSGVDPDFPNTVEGLVKSVNYIVSKYYPQAYYGWQFNLWAYDGHDVPNNGILHKTETMGVTDGLNFIRSKAQLITDYYVSAGVKSYGANFVSIDKYGLDGGGVTPQAAADPAGSTWFWNSDIWNNYLEFVKVMNTSSNLPVILWQIPVGHINTSQASNPYNNGLFPDLNGTSTKYEDSAPVYFLGDIFKPGSTERFNYFKLNAHNDNKITDNGTDTITWTHHMDKAKESGVISILFGAGVNSSTDGVGSPPTDDYWWITKVQRYFDNPISLN